MKTRLHKSIYTTSLLVGVMLLSSCSTIQRFTDRNDAPNEVEGESTNQSQSASDDENYIGEQDETTFQSFSELPIQDELENDDELSNLSQNTKSSEPHEVVTATNLDADLLVPDELDESGKSDSQQIDSPQVVEAEALPVTDLWDRLRSGFQLDDQSLNQALLTKHEQWYRKNPEYFDRLSERAYWFLPFILEEVEKRNMPTEIALLPAIESAFRLTARSKSRATGIWQFISTTGKRFNLAQNWWIEERSDLIQSTQAALDYLEYLSDEFHGDWYLALAAYNAGEGTIGRAISSNRKNNKPTHYTALSLRTETTEYVPKLIAVRNIIQSPASYGLTLGSIPNRPTLAFIDAGSQIDLSLIAEKINYPESKLNYFNPAYKHGVTPPDGPHIIYLPIEHAESLNTWLASTASDQRIRWAIHQVRKGEYLGRISRTHGVSVNAIMQANRLTTNLIKPGQELKIPLISGSTQYKTAASQSSFLFDGKRVHQVQSGESLWSISRQYDVTLASLTDWNNMTKQSIIRPGQKIIVGIN